MRTSAVLAALFLALISGCAGSVPSKPAVMEPLSIDPALLERHPPVAQTQPAATAERPAVPAIEPLETTLVSEPPPPPVEQKSAPKAPARVAAKPAVPVAIVEAPQRIEAPPPPPPAAKTEPTLDIKNLRARLRNTPAIGVFAKLSIENEVDELLERFQALYNSGKRAGTVSLRQPFDTLVQKVIGMIKDGDPPLAATLARSREAIWDFLVHPEKFSSGS